MVDADDADGTEVDSHAQQQQQQQQQPVQNGHHSSSSADAADAAQQQEAAAVNGTADQQQQEAQQQHGDAADANGTTGNSSKAANGTAAGDAGDAAAGSSKPEVLVYESRVLQSVEDLVTAHAVVVDFGNACWTYKHFTDDIQTRQYRCGMARRPTYRTCKQQVLAQGSSAVFVTLHCAGVSF
jgi:hypothetical protein